MTGAADMLGSPATTVSKDDSSYYAPTPTASTYSGQYGSESSESRKLRVGHIYIIRSITCGRQLTLYRGEVVLAGSGSLGSVYWICEEHNGWLGFRNLASNRFLQHSGNDLGMSCSNPGHGWYEYIQVRPHETIDGGYTILCEYYRGTKPMGLIKRNNKEVLARNPPGGVGDLAWTFIEIHEEDS